MRSHNSHLTAIHRKMMPVPTRWLLRNRLVYEGPHTRILDFGCGKCAKVNPITWHNYDPYYNVVVLYQNYYDYIICNYVLCTLRTQKERMDVLRRIQGLLAVGGVAFISINNARPKQGWGWTSRGTYQAKIKSLPLPLIHEERGFKTYRLTRADKL